jgi:hypothetical protein
MKTEIVVALIAGAVSLASAGVAFVSSWQTGVNSRAIEQLKIENNKAEVAAQRQREVPKYFCYVELARTEFKFIDLGENKKTMDFQTLQDNISKIWLEDHYRLAAFI